MLNSVAPDCIAIAEDTILPVARGVEELRARDRGDVRQEVEVSSA